MPFIVNSSKGIILLNINVLYKCLWPKMAFKNGLGFGTNLSLKLIKGNTSKIKK
jgi:hypothetical protein